MSSHANHEGYKALRQGDSEVEQQHQGSEWSLKQEDFSTEDDGMITKSKEISTWRVVLNMFNYMEGIGFLALPYAIRQGGITILIGLIAMSFILAYTA